MSRDTSDEDNGRHPASDEGGSIPITAGTINSRDLFRNGREIIIAHGPELYRLRLTSQNKLILTK